MEKSLLNYYKLIYESKFNKQIAVKFVDTYLYVRYGNYFDEDSKVSNITRKITRAFDNLRKELYEEMDEKMVPLINSYKNVALHFYNIDQLYLL